jgi:hypothetical protein
MLPNKAEAYRAENTGRVSTTGADRSLQRVLWALWTLAVTGSAFWNWRADVGAQRPINLLGMVIYSLLTGLVGLLVMTLIELWLEPERFLD